jgi:hypothetical protein
MGILLITRTSEVPNLSIYADGSRNRVKRVKLSSSGADGLGRQEGKLERDIAQERQKAHALLDMLPAEKLSAVRSLLQLLVEPLSSSLASAPLEEEEITSDTAAALDRARRSLASGEAVPHEEILREFGLTK